MAYIAFELHKKSRHQLAQHFVPKFPEFIGHHVTYKFGIPPRTRLPHVPETAFIVGYVEDVKGLEALVVNINGTTTRPDGKVYHITWSLDREAGFKPVHSNNLLSYTKPRIIDPIKIILTPKFFK